MGIIAGNGSSGSGVGKETCKTWVVFTMVWMVSKSYFAIKIVGEGKEKIKGKRTSSFVALNCASGDFGV